MNKWKLYLDTSIISYLDQKDTPDSMQITHLFWDKVKAGAYDIVFSRVGLEEILACTKDKRDTLLSYLEEIDYTFIDIHEDIDRIADKIVELGILKQKHYTDCQHIATAIVSGCDAIVSWNFKHIVNKDTIKGVKKVTDIENRDVLLIYTPQLFTGEDDD